MQSHSEIAEFLWNIANLIKDDYAAKDNEDVILPFTLLRRLDCVLQPTRQAVRNAATKYKTTPEQTRDALLMKAAGQKFYNTSEYSLEELIRRPADIVQNFSAYLAGFSVNVKDILYNFSGGEEKGLSPIYETLARKRLILKITQAFSEADLSPETVDNHGMGTIFEYLIRKFKEASNEAAGQFYTPRDIIRLMVKLMFEPDRAKLAKESLVGIYDPACGTGGMLTIAKEHLLGSINSSLEVYLYGQEINEKTYAIAKADMLMKGEDPENIKRENTLSYDLFPGKQFNYMLSNPPFGKNWKNIREEIEAEHEMGAAGRYAPGLPYVEDGAMLFLLHKLSKIAPQGSKIALIFNGSPLFNGDAGSGPSNIRKHVLENDWLDAIVALPSDLFYNTNIYTYIWLINNKKPAQRHNKVQLINAINSDYYTMLQRNLGKKRMKISEDQSASILGIYEAFEESKVSKIFDTTDFGYTKVCVERPLRLRFDLTEAQRQRLQLDSTVLKLKDGRAQQLAAVLEKLIEHAPWNNDAAFFSALNKELPWKPTVGLVKVMRACLGERDEKADPVLGTNGQQVPDSNLRDFENVSLKDNIETYFAREVIPHVPDAWMDRSRDKVGYEISFTKYFYEHTALRTMTEITAELLELDEETGKSVAGDYKGMSADFSVRQLKFCDLVIMGQSPSGSSVNLEGKGVQFLQGNAEFGEISPTATQATTDLRKLCQQGDVLLSVRAPVGAVNVADQTYAIGRGLCAIRPRLHDGIFLRYLLKNQVEALNSIATGTTFTAVSAAQVGQLPVPFPTFSEQCHIATYLDEQTAKIDRLIEMRRRQIALLKEQRAALIQQAVTRGINPNVPMKDSDLPWLGEIPAHWEVKRIKYVAEVESGHTPSRSVEAYWQNCDIPWVSLNDSGYLRDHDCIEDTFYKVSAIGIENSSAHILPSRAVVFSRDATVGLCAITIVPMAVSQHFIAYLCSPGLIPEYLLFVLRSMTQELEKLSTGATIPTIGMDDVKNLATPVPPPEEQKAICAYIAKVSPILDSAIAAYARQLELLTEYRGSLIHECVTGQRTVPEVATA